MSFQIGDAKIKESENEKFLGLWVNNDLSWTKHLKKLQEELLHRLFTLRQMEQVIPKSLLPSIADGIVVSILRYGLGIYCPVSWPCIFCAVSDQIYQFVLIRDEERALMRIWSVTVVTNQMCE